MKKYLIVILSILALNNCATNKLHFAKHSEIDGVMNSINSAKKQIVPKLKLEEGCGVINNPKEFSKCVWHAGYAETFEYMEGYQILPFPEMDSFFADSIPNYFTMDEETELSIRINKIFFKTWLKDGKNYKACYTKFKYTQNGISKNIENTVKLPDSETRLVNRNVIVYEPKKNDVIKLAILGNIANFLNKNEKQ